MASRFTRSRTAARAARRQGEAQPQVNGGAEHDRQFFAPAREERAEADRFTRYQQCGGGIRVVRKKIGND